MKSFIKKKRKDDENVSILTHLGELRNRLKVVILANVAAALVMYNFAEALMQYLLDINPGMELVYINPSELLLTYIQISFIAAFIICSPITIYHLWAFVEKGLYPKEKLYIFISLIFGMLCFVVGVAFCYEIVLPTTLAFFARIEIGEVSSMISVQSYANFVNMMLFSFGVVFEMPILVFVLTKLGILKPDMLKKHRGVLIVGIFIFAALITPPDVVSQIMLGIPMVMLLQMSIFISVLVHKGNEKKRIKQEALES